MLPRETDRLRQRYEEQTMGTSQLKMFNFAHAKIDNISVVGDCPDLVPDKQNRGIS
jgi:hypothetical protein